MCPMNRFDYYLIYFIETGSCCLARFRFPGRNLLFGLVIGTMIIPGTTIPIAISGFFGQHQFTQWGYVFAMSVLSLLPVLLIFICFQKYFVSGLQAGGIKG